ncbi:MAG: hypothetical protein HZC48_11920 [Nitrospirae bacterium]|nr:hypothetical protein [Nitrospirota bacterium]
MKTIFLSLMIIVLFAATTCAEFIRGPFSGKVIDLETKEPIEGAVVVVIWWKRVITGSPGGPTTYLQDIKETLTDKNGKYYMEEYKGFTINPLATIKNPEFLIYKPGYCVLPESFVDIPACDNMKPRTNYYDALVKGGTLIELPRLKTREERLRANMISPTDNNKEWPLLHKALDEENKLLWPTGIRRKQ